MSIELFGRRTLIKGIGYLVYYYLLCYASITSKNSGLKQKMYYFTNPEVCESKSGLESLQRLHQAIGLGWSHLEAWLVLEDLFPRWCTHMSIGRRPQFLASTDQRPQFFTTLNLSTGLLCPYGTVVGFPREWRERERERVRERKRERRICDVFENHHTVTLEN
jgi:hypothetical protein